MDLEAPGARPPRILFVCTANRIRSPFAEALAREACAQRSLEVQTASAGTNTGLAPGEVGSPVMDRIAAEAVRHGLDLGSHRSRQVTVELLSAADLVVTMTGVHVTEVLSIAPESRSRTLTLRSCAVRSETSGVGSWTPHGLREWADSGAEATLEELLGGQLDIADPVGGPRRAYRRAAEEIADLLETFLSNA